jgi:hypothetical protein
VRGLLDGMMLGRGCGGLVRVVRLVGVCHGEKRLADLGAFPSPGGLVPRRDVLDAFAPP